MAGFSASRMSCARVGLQVEIAAFWKSLGITQMLSQGSEGYRALGPYDPTAPTTYPCALTLRAWQSCPLPSAKARFDAVSSAAGYLLNVTHCYGCDDAQWRLSHPNLLQVQ